MTERLYYTDARLSTFSASVIAVERDGRHVVLDRTAFYPTSGGQLHDMGHLGDAHVIDVVDEESRIVHVCADVTPYAVGDRVEGRIDWNRRFDHMQQHSGQHLLSALLADEYGWPTVSVHFGADTNTVDIAAATMDANVVATVEEQLNRLAAENRAINVLFEDASHASGLRKASDRAGMLRIIEIDGIDRSACGGTHVARTGEIGSISLRRVERTKGHTRLEFVCGLRAVARARADVTLLNTSARIFTASPDDLPVLVEAQQRRIAVLERERKSLVAELSRFEARAHFDAASPDAEGTRRIRIDDIAGPVRDAEPLVNALLALGPCVVLAISPSTGGLMLGASEGGGVDAGQVLRAALQEVGGRGGGSPRLAQGSAAGKLEAVVAALGFS